MISGSIPRAKLRHLRWDSQLCRWDVTRVRGVPHPLDLLRSTYFVGVSLKNPRFSKKWLDAVSSDVSAMNGKLVLSVVDIPYFASLAVRSMADSERTVEHEKLLRMRNEVAALVRRVRLAGDVAPEVVDWAGIDAAILPTLREELRLAFSRRGVVFSLIVGQTEMIRGEKMVPSDWDTGCEFLLQEIPVLVDIYYRLLVGAIDVYPGPNAQFFWHLDAGLLAHELPLTSALARSSRPLTCAHVELSR